MVKLTIPDWLAKANHLPETFECRIIGETKKAYRVCYGKHLVWLPKSHTKVVGHYTLPEVTVAHELPYVEEIGTKLFLFCSFEDTQKAASIFGGSWDKKIKVWKYADTPQVRKDLCEKFPTLDLKLTFGEIELPTTLTLYPYQKVGVEFLQTRERAILADDMGLGKTIQALSAAKGKVWVLCPATLTYNWKAEIEKWLDKTCVVVEGTKKKRLALMEEQADIYISSWEFLRSGTDADRYHLNQLLKFGIDTLICDEAHKIKNRKSQLFKCFIPLAKKVNNIYLLTGTPITKKPPELWSLLHAIDTKRFSSYWKFVDNYCDVSTDGFGYVIGDLLPTQVDNLKALLDKYVLRRVKSEVLKELPEKIIQKLFVYLDPAAQKNYHDMEKDLMTILNGADIRATVVIAKITRLRQICIDPSLMVPEMQQEPLKGPKVNALLDIMESTEKIIIFSQFTIVCTRLHTTLAANGYKGVVLTGKMTSNLKNEAVDTFQNDPTAQYIIVSTLAGGQGLTLTAASTVVFMDKCWNPAWNIQAQDRAHRIGQKRSVHIIELITKDTIEEDLENMLEHKQEQITTLFEQDVVKYLKAKTL